MRRRTAVLDGLDSGICDFGCRASCGSGRLCVLRFNGRRPAGRASRCKTANVDAHHLERMTCLSVFPDESATGQSTNDRQQTFRIEHYPRRFLRLVKCPILVEEEEETVKAKTLTSLDGHPRHPVGGPFHDPNSEDAKDDHDAAEDDVDDEFGGHCTRDNSPDGNVSCSFASCSSGRDVGKVSKK